MLYKRGFLIGIAAYLAYILLAIVFYKERTIFTDIAFHLFEIIRTNSVAIQNSRFVAVVTQVFPLMASRTDMQLADVMLVYSIAFPVFYFACYLFCGLALKNYRMALVMLFFNILFATDSFYWIQSELPQGVAVMVLIWASLEREDVPKNKLVQWLAIILLPTVVAFAHPILLFAFFYCALFFFITGRIEKKQLFTILAFYIVALIIKNIFFRNQYESGALGGAYHNLKGSLFDNFAMRRFIKNCFDKYYWIPVCGVSICWYYLIKRNWKLLLLFVAAMVGYLFMINISYPDQNTTNYYIENLYLPMAIFIALPLVYDIMPAMRGYAYLLFLLIIVTGVVRIYTNHTLFTTRLNWERNFLSQHADEKLLIDEKCVPIDTLLMTWGTPYEFWLLSTVENGKTASINISNRLHEIVWAADTKKGFVSNWGVFDYSTLPSGYFNFTDTVNAYRVINSQPKQ